VDGFDKGAWGQFYFKKPISFVLAIVLVVPNIWLSYLKWTLTLKTLEVNSNRSTKVQSFFAGIVTGMLTPNMLGNFLGRFYYFDKSHRNQIIAFTMLSNFGQFIASITFGTLAVIAMGEVLILDESRNILIALCFGVVVSYVIYFFIENFLGRFKSREFINTFRSTLQSHRLYRVQLLGLSIGRFLIFTLQFSLMLHAFGANWNFDLISAIWQVYLITMLAPSLFLGKIGVKESISLFVLSGLGLNDFSILFSSLLIWFINSMSPALVGLFICKDIK
jgi:hypothetical protein